MKLKILKDFNLKEGNEIKKEQLILDTESLGFKLSKTRINEALKMGLIEIIEEDIEEDDK